MRAALWRGILAALLLAAALVPAATAYAQVQVAVIGDSNVAGRGVSPSDAYPAKLERALKAKGLNVQVRNSGINGDTTTGVLSRLDSAAPQGTQVAVLWVGINDERRGSDSATVDANRREIANRLRARGIQVVTLRGPSFIDLHRSPNFAQPDRHLNPAGYDQVVARTLSQVVAAVGKAKR